VAEGDPRRPEGAILALGWSPEAGGAMRRASTLRVGPEGIQGDRYRTGSGFWSADRTSALTVVDLDDVDAAARELGVALDPLSLRRNVVVRGCSLGAWHGRRFRLGEVLLEGERACDPCMHLERHLGLPGLERALAGRGGLRVRVLEEGILRVGDPWTAA
jgi:MOSC domain-containing protein YiiM